MVSRFAHVERDRDLREERQRCRGAGDTRPCRTSAGTSRRRAARPRSSPIRPRSSVVRAADRCPVAPSRASRMTATPGAGTPRAMSRTCVVIMRHELPQPQRRDLALLLGRDGQFRRRIVRQPRLEQRQHLAGCLACRADDEDIAEPLLIVDVPRRQPLLDVRWSASRTPACSSDDHAETARRSPIRGCAANASSQSAGRKRRPDRLSRARSSRRHRRTGAPRPSRAQRADPQQRRNSASAREGSRAFSSSSVIRAGRTAAAAPRRRRGRC